MSPVARVLYDTLKTNDALAHVSGLRPGVSYRQLQVRGSELVQIAHQRFINVGRSDQCSCFISYTEPSFSQMTPDLM